MGCHHRIYLVKYSEQLIQWQLYSRTYEHNTTVPRRGTIRGDLKLRIQRKLIQIFFHSRGALKLELNLIIS